jgi:hypothetical protein
MMSSLSLFNGAIPSPPILRSSTHTSPKCINHHPKLLVLAQSDRAQYSAELPQSCLKAT